MIFNKYKVTSLYGYRTLSNGDSRHHNGIDIVGIEDKNVISPVDGIVKSSTIIKDKSNQTWEWGNYVRVDSKDGYKHYFCHLDSRAVEVGQLIKKGDCIGIMGNTGYSFGIHTHYGIRDKFDTWIDPLQYYKIELKENVIYTRDYKTAEEIKIEQIEKDLIEIKGKARRYKNINEMPEWLQIYINKWVEAGFIKGNTNGDLDFTEDMLRCLIIVERMLEKF